MSLDKKEIVVEAVSKTSHGIKVGDIWYNKATGLTEEAETNIMSMMENIAKGDKVSLEIDTTNHYFSITMIEKGKGGSWGDDMTNFEDLLNDAHKHHNLTSINTKMLSVDWEKKTALFKATVGGLVKNKDGDYVEVYFEGHGDATQDNIDSDKVKIHWIRMSETRAIVRALRFFTNNAKVAAEELGSGDIPDDVLNASSEKEDKDMIKTNDEIKEDHQGTLKKEE